MLAPPLLIVERASGDLANGASIGEMAQVLLMGDRPTAIGHPAARGEIGGIERHGLAVPMVGGAAEIA